MTEKLPAKKSKIPYFFFVFFAVIFAVNIFYIYISKKTWSGVVTEDSYHKGLHYNQILSDEKKQKELGWQMKISYKNLGNGTGDLRVFVQNKNHQKISDVEVTAYFRRPTQEGFDFSQKLEFKNGEYVAKINFPLRGQWEFKVNATKAEDSFQETKRYVVQ